MSLLVFLLIAGNCATGFLAVVFWLYAKSMEETAVSSLVALHAERDKVAESRIKRTTAEDRILQQAMMNHRLLQTLAAVAERRPESKCWIISDFDLGMAQGDAWKQWTETVQGPNSGGVA